MADLKFGHYSGRDLYSWPPEGGHYVNRKVTCQAEEKVLESCQMQRVMAAQVERRIVKGIPCTEN
jgi:hypothetical protein